jgi:hypothetical protein
LALFAGATLTPIPGAQATPLEGPEAEKSPLVKFLKVPKQLDVRASALAT